MLYGFKEHYSISYGSNRLCKGSPTSCFADIGCWRTKLCARKCCFIFICGNKKYLKTTQKPFTYTIPYFFNFLGHHLPLSFSFHSTGYCWNTTKTKNWHNQCLYKAGSHQNHTKNIYWPYQTTISTYFCSICKKIGCEERWHLSIWS